MARSIRSRLNTPSSAQRSELASSLLAAMSSGVSVGTPHSSSALPGGSSAMRASNTISNLIGCSSTLQTGADAVLIGSPSRRPAPSFRQPLCRSMAFQPFDCRRWSVAVRDTPPSPIPGSRCPAIRGIHRSAARSRCRRRTDNPIAQLLPVKRPKNPRDATMVRALKHRHRSERQAQGFDELLLGGRKCRGVEMTPIALVDAQGFARRQFLRPMNLLGELLEPGVIRNSDACGKPARARRFERAPVAVRRSVEGPAPP